MATEQQLLDAISTIEAGVGAGFIGASIVDLESGMTLAVKSLRPDFDLTAASAFNSEMVKQKQKIMRALSLRGSIEDMLITLSDQIHIIRVLSDGAFLYLAVDRASVNLAIARSAVSKGVAGIA